MVDGLMVTVYQPRQLICSGLGWANGIAHNLGSHSDTRNGLRFHHPRIPCLQAWGVSTFLYSQEIYPWCYTNALDDDRIYAMINKKLLQVLYKPFIIMRLYNETLAQTRR